MYLTDVSQRLARRYKVIPFAKGTEILNAAIKLAKKNRYKVIPFAKGTEIRRM